MSQTRRLAAILAADVASHLTQAPRRLILAIPGCSSAFVMPSTACPPYKRDAPPHDATRPF